MKYGFFTRKYFDKHSTPKCWNQINVKTPQNLWFNEGNAVALLVFLILSIFIFQLQRDKHNFNHSTTLENFFKSYLRPLQ